MSTSASISVIHKNGTVSSIYCHFDGYLNHVGRVLFEDYDTLEKVEELMLKGDLSCLGHDIDSCEYYVDRGEELHLMIYANAGNFFSYFEPQDYDYLFYGGSWEVSIYGEDWMPLEKALKTEL
jgi:hypothetical protein